MTEDQVFATLEREKPKWRALAYKCGAKEFEIDQVIQNAYICVFKYADYENIVRNGSVSGAYMYTVIRTRVLELRGEFKKRKFLLARTEAEEFMQESFDGDSIYQRYETENWCDEHELERFNEILHNIILEYLGPHLLTVWLLVTCGPDKMSYRDIERRTGVSYMTIYGYMRKVQDVLREPVIKECLRNNWELVKL